MAQINGATAVERLAGMYEDPVAKFFREQQNIDRILALHSPPISDPVREAIEGISASSAVRFGIDYNEIFGGLRWQAPLYGLDRDTIDRITGARSALSNAVDRINGSLSANAEAMQALQSPIASQMKELSGIAAGLDVTSRRFAVLAGITDTYGIGGLHHDALGALLGSFHTSLNLPSEYWSDFDFRRALYRDSDVDEGLIEADPETAIALGITSGAIAGEITEEGAHWTARTASGLVTVSSANLAGDTFEYVGSIEKSLRKLVSIKLESMAGPKWFKQRVPGEIRIRVKDRRSSALKAGEKAADPVEYLTLGELAEIVLRTDNWEEAFEPIFREQSWFRRDAEIIIAARNPNSHYRANDTVRLMEIVAIGMRLEEWIDDDGDWKDERDADF